jgi:hypothetical protein
MLSGVLAGLAELCEKLDRSTKKRIWKLTDSMVPANCDESHSIRSRTVLRFEPIDSFHAPLQFMDRKQLIERCISNVTTIGDDGPVSKWVHATVIHAREDQQLLDSGDFVIITHSQPATGVIRRAPWRAPFGPNLAPGLYETPKSKGWPTIPMSNVPLFSDFVHCVKSRCANVPKP